MSDATLVPVPRAWQVENDPVLDATERPIAEQGTEDCAVETPQTVSDAFLGCACTRRRGHKGLHVAHGINHQAVFAWDEVGA